MTRMEYSNDRVFQLLWNVSLAPDEGNSFMKLN